MQSASSTTPSNAATSRAAADLAALDEHADKLLAQDLVEPFMAAARALLDEAPGRSYVPRGAFAVSRRDVRFLSEWTPPTALGDPASPTSLDALVRLDEQLAARGIDLLLVPLPRTVEIYPERLQSELLPTPGFCGVDPKLTRFLRVANGLGLETMHLTPAFAAARETRDPEDDRYLFLDKNNHWTPRGIRVTANLIGQRLLQSGLVEAGPRSADGSWRRERRLGEYPMPPINDEPQPAAPVWLEAIVDAEGENAFDSDPTAPILLLGDSNAQWYRRDSSGLPEHLAAALGQTIDVIALQGARTAEVWQRLARRQPGRDLASKQVIVWVFESTMLGSPKTKFIDLGD